jgi:hypothetical protein
MKPTVKILAEIIREAFLEQAEKSEGKEVAYGEVRDFTIDGDFDLMKIAKKINRLYQPTNKDDL